MNLYYTNVAYADQAQNRPDLSLGGFKSSSMVPSADYNNLFGDVSVYSVQTKKDEYICLMLRNDLDVDVTGVKLYINYPENPTFTIQVGAVSPNLDGQVERIQTPYQRPMYAQFYDATGVDNAVALGDLTKTSMLGLWFKKTINVDNIKAQQTDQVLVDYFTANNTNPPTTIQDIDIVISWD